MASADPSRFGGIRDLGEPASHTSVTRTQNFLPAFVPPSPFGNVTNGDLDPIWQGPNTSESPGRGSSKDNGSTSKMTQPPKTKPLHDITSVEHALRVAALLQLEGPVTVTEVASRLGVTRSTAHRILAVLVYRDFAVQRQTSPTLLGLVSRLLRTRLGGCASP